MSQQGRDRMAPNDLQLDERGSRQSRVTDALSESGPGSVYDDRADRDSLGDRESLPPRPVKPPGGDNIDSDPGLPGNSAAEYFNDIRTTPSDEMPPTPTSANALSRRRTSSHGLSYTQSPSHGRTSHRARNHSSARDILRLLLSAEGSESKEALAMLRRAQERLETESQRANEAERRVQEANGRWKLINQARLMAQADASKAAEELRLYKLQLEAAQQQIARANDMITLTDKERAHAEDEAAKARRLAKKYEMEREIQRAREEGRREGLRQGLREAELEERLMREQYGRPRYRSGYRSRARDIDPDDETYIGDDGYYNPEDVDEVYVTPSAAPSQYEGMPAQGRQQMPRSAPPDGFPAQARSTTSRGQRPGANLMRSLTSLGRNGRAHRGDMDRNVAVNPSNAPDVATIIDDEPINTLASPLPPEQTAQLNHTTPTHMPEPNFNPDPSEVHPIVISNPPRSSAHPPITEPPLGYIPPQDVDGTIRLPPPHEMGQHPLSPGSYQSPLPNAANLPGPELPQRERDLIARDFGYPGGQHPRPQGRHRYQKSVADSEDSVATANLSIISPPSRQAAVQNRLPVIPEYASPNGSMRQAEAPVYPNSPRARSIRRAETEGIYVPGDPVLDPDLANRQPMANEGPVRPDMAGTFSPRSNHSRFSGPKRPSRITMPAPLARNDLDQLYTRPRRNSGASGSTNSGFVGTPLPPRSRVQTPAPEYVRSRPGTAANTPANQNLPEINIVAPLSDSLNRSFSRSESQQSRKSIANGRREAGIASPRTRKARTYDPRMYAPSPAPMPPQPEPPSPMDIPGMPKGFVPTSPMPSAPMPTTPIPDGAPPGFVPTSPAVPHGAPPGFVPTSPAVPPSTAPGFVPTSPAAPPGAPLGFVPTSPAVPPPGAPPGFVPTSPAVPPGAPAGFVPTSPAIPPGAPPIFVPVSPIAPVPTTMPAIPLPQPHPAVSPSMSVSGALPVLVRSTSENSTRYQDAAPTVTRVASVGSGVSRSPRVSFAGPNAGFNSRAASDWDTHSAWGGQHSERQSPRPVPGPDLSATIVRPGSSLSRRNSGPVIPDLGTFRPSRRSSRAEFDAILDPSGVPLPASTAPSLARSGRTRSHGGSRSGMPTPTLGTPAHPSVSGLPPAGLGSPYSRRLDPHPEDEDEYEVVPSEDSGNTLTTPPARRDLPPPGHTPMISARNSLYRSPAPSQRRVSLSVPGDTAEGPSLHKAASRQSIGSNTSYTKYNPEEYVDPAVLTSGPSRLLPLPPEEASAEPNPATAARGKKSNKKKDRRKR